MSDRTDKLPDPPKAAFPIAGGCVDGLTVEDDGMSLRDWFAGQALACLTVDAYAQDRAAAAFLIADEMIKLSKESE